MKLISWHYKDLLARQFGINKMKEFIGFKYYWPSLRKEVESYIKGYNVCLGLKTVKYKLYVNLQLLFMLIK